MARLEGKVAIVTGAAQGIGAAFAEALAAEGAAVALADIDDATPTAAAIERGGGRAIALNVDVTDPPRVQAMVRATLEAFGAVHILVNNAAIAGRLEHKPLTEIGTAEWQRIMGTNVGGTFECMKAVVPAMQRRRYGKIINLTSAAFFLGAGQMAHYLASKGAVIGLTRSAARELGADGICVNAIAPGLTMSENLRAHPQMSGEHAREIAATRAIAREELPADLFGTLLYLASPDSDFVTGQTIVVDGGGAMN